MIDLPSDALRGSYVPLVTPFRDGEVDESAYEAIIERQIAGGSHGIVVCGTSGEPSVLTIAERQRLAEVALKASAGRIPVVVATGSQSHLETVELTEHAAAIGADGLLIVTPYYIKPPPRGLVAYYADLGRRTDLPMMLYHIPGRAAVSVEIDTLVAMSEAAPTLVGMKHAANDLGLVTEALERLGPAFRVMVGLEELSFPMLALGAAGTINAIGNVVPDKIAALCDVVAAGDLAAGRLLHVELFELNRAVFFDTNPIPVKYMMRRLGLLETNEHRLPMMPPTPSVAAQLDGVLQRAGLL
jgi:4-hydroxy-tetrahydrodipicolinate synthase